MAYSDKLEIVRGTPKSWRVFVRHVSTIRGSMIVFTLKRRPTDDSPMLQLSTITGNLVVLDDTSFELNILPIHTSNLMSCCPFCYDIVMTTSDNKGPFEILRGKLHIVESIGVPSIP